MRLAAALWCLALALRARSEPTTSEESLLEIHDLIDEMTDYEKDAIKEEPNVHGTFVEEAEAKTLALCETRLKQFANASAQERRAMQERQFGGPAPQQ